MAEELPRLFAGRYEIGELIGRGGMAEVHIGRDNRLGRTVAIKALRTDLLTDPTFQARFRREAQSAASLNHPSIVSVYDSGEEVIPAEDGSSHRIPYIVMEYVEGHTVRDLVRDGEALPIDEAVEITIGVLNALEYSHHSGIVHRDIKPANVMLTPTGAIKVMDFGIARVLADTSSTMTQTQAVVGTAQYLSPEQAKGESVDARSDLYSTGCLLYELLTGKPPFTGDSPVSVAYQHVGEQAPPPSSIAPDVPDALDRITMKALAKNPDERYSSAAAFRSDLENALATGVVSAPAVGATQVMDPTSPFGQQPTSLLPQEPQGFPLPEQPEEEEEKSRSKAWWWVALVALLVIGGVVAFVLLNKEPPVEEPAEVEVPVLEQGMSESEVRNALDEAGLEIDIQDPVPHNDIEEGLLVEWDPESGALVEEGSVIDVWFSSGPDSISMIDITGYKKDMAQQLLIDQGFDPKNFVWETEHVERTDKDIVTRTEPQEGQEIGPDQEIVIYLATGLVEVPDVVGEQLSDAEDMIPDGIQINTTPIPVPVDDYEPGTVLSQTQEGLLPWNERITLEVAEAAPEPDPEPTNSPDPDDSSDPSPDPSDTESPQPPDDEDGGDSEEDD